MSDEAHFPFIREAIKLADTAVEHGNHPFGAVLVKDGVVLLEAENTVTTGHDMTNHAEMNLVRLANSHYDPEFLKDCILYTSTEPCAMCMGAIYWSGIKTMVYACSEGRLKEITGGGLNMASRTLMATASNPVTVIGPILQDEADPAHLRFW
ncbi:MAG: nucleoside deaminase [Anaerolineae bacterium]